LSADALERAWSGDFGDDYTERNAVEGTGRRAFWEALLARYSAPRVLEVGCNVGANLQWINADTYGVDINRHSLAMLRDRLPAVNALVAPARELPFRDAWFDLVFTMGVLIHQPDETLPQVMSEMVRVSRRYVLCGEYFAPDTTEVPYRGLSGSLFKRDYGHLFGEFRMRRVDHGSLARPDWDDLTWWLFEKVE
jgi:pseudaminic acid biosynthesis-associated methylase